MALNALAAIVAGLLGTAVMTGMMLAGRRLNLPAPDRAGSLGYIAHFVLGALFALGYAVVYSLVPGNIVALGALLGVVHWLAVGWMFALAPMAHAGMKAGRVQETGPYMLRSLGMSGFVAGLLGHIAFGIVVGLVYGLMSGSFGG
jgi:uncharacterized membrane protein YagU involved in acid resistance